MHSAVQGFTSAFLGLTTCLCELSSGLSCFQLILLFLQSSCIFYTTSLFLQALHNTRLLSSYAAIDPRVKYLCYTMKVFTKVSIFLTFQKQQCLQQEMITIKGANHVSFSRYVTLEMHLEVAFHLTHILLWCFIFFSREIHQSSLFFKRYSIPRKKSVFVQRRMSILNLKGSSNEFNIILSDLQRTKKA